MISTHILDTAHGRPAAGLAVTLSRRENSAWSVVAKGVTDADGRVKEFASGQTEPGEYRLFEDMRRWHEVSGVETDIRDDTRFISRIQDFRAWAGEKNPSGGSFRMEFFYRDMRRRTGLLMEDDQPVGGKWNFDTENRKPPPKDLRGPPVLTFPPDAITTDVTELVRRSFPTHYGSADNFALPVTSEQAELALTDFIVNRLPLFGDWQDTMKMGESTLYHALVSTSINTGLLCPLAACRAA